MNERTLSFCRFADDWLIHCRSKAEAQDILQHLEERLADRGLKIHPDKTRIIYCKDGKRKDRSNFKRRRISRARDVSGLSSNLNAAHLEIPADEF